jgi:hypothetical protein
MEVTKLSCGTDKTRRLSDKCSPFFNISRGLPPQMLNSQTVKEFSLCNPADMVYLKSSFWRFCLLCLPLSSALIIPQSVLAEDAEDTVSDVTRQLETNEVEFNITDYTSPGEWEPTAWDYDVAIVGGGPAGLAASMSLARVARTSILYDSQEYRNGQTRYMHDVLGQDGGYYICSYNEGLGADCI